MLKSYRIILLAAAVLCHLIVYAENAADYTLENANDTEIDAVLAEVNGVPIALSDVLLESWREESQAYAVYSSDVLPEIIAAIRMRTLNDLVNRELIIEEFKRKNLQVETAHVENFLEQICHELGAESRADLPRVAARFHTTVPELRRRATERLMVEIMLMSFVYSEVNITPRELAAYLEEHRQEYVTPARVRLRLLKLDTNRADAAARRAEVEAELAKPDAAERFSGLVNLFSDAPRTGAGDLGWLEIARLRPEFLAALGADPEPGRLTGAIEIPGEGVFYLQVMEFQDAAEPDWREVRLKLRKELEDTRRGEVLKQYLQKLRTNAILHFRVN